MTGEQESLPVGWGSNIARVYETSARMNLQTIAMSAVGIMVTSVEAYVLDNPWLFVLGLLFLLSSMLAAGRMWSTTQGLQHAIELIEEVLENDLARREE